MFMQFMSIHALLVLVGVAAFLPQTQSITKLCIQSKIRTRTQRSYALFNGRGGYDYLANADSNNYIQNILRRSIDSTKTCVQADCKNIEVAFPESRKNDISVTESLNINRAFAFEYTTIIAREFQCTKNDIWLIFPDKGEATLGIKEWDRISDTSTPFTLASIDTAYAQLQAMSANSEGGGGDFPRFLVSVNPGFNVEEWILLAELGEKLKVQSEETVLIVINGNLDRLRNGYYPSFFFIQS